MILKQEQKKLLPKPTKNNRSEDFEVQHSARWIQDVIRWDKHGETGWRIIDLQKSQKVEKHPQAGPERSQKVVKGGHRYQTR